MKKALTNIIKEPLPDREKHERTPWRFWPSEASCKNGKEVIGRCLRRTYYIWKNVPETNPVNDRVKLLGKIGNFVEYETRKELLTKKLYPFEANKKKNRKFRVTLVDDLVLSGEVDVLIKNDKEFCGMEVKSYSNSTYQIIGKPKYPHLLQTFLYLVYYAKPQQPYFIIKYMPSMISKYATSVVYHRIDCIKADGDIFPVINGGVDRTVSINGIIRRYKEAKYHVKNNLLPKRDFIKSSTPCKQCPFKNFCKTDREGKTIEEDNVT